MLPRPGAHHQAGSVRSGAFRGTGQQHPAPSVQRELGLPGAISANALCGVLSRVATREELAQAVARVKQQLEET